MTGSVLPTGYEWGDRVAHGQVQRIRNDRAARDWPVGVLCAGLAGLFIPRSKRDIGTAGVDGPGELTPLPRPALPFTDFDPKVTGLQPTLRPCCRVR